MSIRASLELRGKVRAVHLNLGVMGMEVVFNLGPGWVREIMYIANRIQ